MTKHYLYGSNNSDTVTVGSPNWDAADDYDIYSYGGNDKLRLYSDGKLWVDAGTGNDDILVGGSGSATVYGGAGNDIINHLAGILDDGVAKMYGGDGDDTIEGIDDEADVLDGGAGNDILRVHRGNTAYGGLGDDYYFTNETDQTQVKIVEYAGGGYDTLRANFDKYNFGADIDAYEMHKVKDFTAIGNDQANKVTALSGNDYFDMKGGNDIVYAGGGHDTVWAGSGNDFVDGGIGNDTINGGDGNDTIYGGRGVTDDGMLQFQKDADVIHGGNGDDTINGGWGDDELYGDAGNDTFINVDNWYAFSYGGAGNDTYVTNFTGRIVENANEGIDTIKFFGAQGGLNPNVENLIFVDHPDGAEHNYTGISQIAGNLLANQITGNAYRNFLWGNAGNDTLDGKGGDDQLHGDTGNDRVYGGDGQDKLFGDDGNDIVYGGAGVDQIVGGAGDDEVAGNDGNDFIEGEDGNDTAYGGEGADQITGDNGYDTLFGEGGNDRMSGGSMADYLYGGEGNDDLRGDGDMDYLYGGAGNDEFGYRNLSDSTFGSGIDKIWDFETGADKINVSYLDANSGLIGNQAFTWLGVDTVRGATPAGSLWGQHFDATVYNPEFVRVYADVNGDGTADFAVDVMHMTSLQASDFIL